VIFIRRHGISAADALAAAAHVFDFRKTHALPADLEPPPSSWEVRFAGRAKECGVEVSLQQAYKVVREFWVKALASK
jgi:hypothetical protein